ncbi:MAG TPA: universal stress protein [Gemmatimonadota bacterium]|nr:universal stress protein [Gemmatimonadota bacterium]
MTPYQRILLATDFSDTARHAAEDAAMLARACGATLHYLHVVEPVGYWEGFDLKHFPSPEVYDELRTSARLAIEDFHRELGGPDSHQIEVRQGKPFVEIIRAARETPADLIVVGSHGIGGIAETLFGSTAEKVIRKAPCAVLVVRHPEHASSMP